jgi:hypothetical protein
MPTRKKKVAKKKKSKTILEKIRNGIAAEARGAMQDAIREGVKEIKDAFKATKEFQVDDERLFAAIDQYIAEYLKAEEAYAYFDICEEGIYIDLRIGDGDEQYFHRFVPDSFVFDNLGDPYAEFGGPGGEAQLDDVKSRLKYLDEFIAKLSEKRDELKASAEKKGIRDKRHPPIGG